MERAKRPTEPPYAFGFRRLVADAVIPYHRRGGLRVQKGFSGLPRVRFNFVESAPACRLQPITGLTLSNFHHIIGTQFGI